MTELQVSHCWSWHGSTDLPISSGPRARGRVGGGERREGEGGNRIAGGEREGGWIIWLQLWNEGFLARG